MVPLEWHSVLVGLPIEENEDITQLLNSSASRWPIPSPRWTYKDQCIWLEVRSTETHTVRREIDRAKQAIDWLNQDIENGNRALPSYIRPLVEERMRAVDSHAQTFQRLAEVLGAELRLTPETERRLQQTPRVKEAIARLRRPQPQQKAMPRLQPEEFQTILDTIEYQCRTFERTPADAAKLGEEGLRNMILSSLNGAFNLDATGESFSNRGKTDIRLNVPEGGIFIAEAKIWGGPKTVSEALEQILGYLTWRDAYGVVLLFSRNKGFSKVRADIPEAIKSEASLRGEVHQVGEHHWLARHVLPDDDYQTVEIHFLAYNIYSDS